MKMYQKKQGFTLIELLVVIAIIAILAAILFPVFAKARGMARRTACLSNMKQIALAVQMYADDYDSQIPPVLNWGSTPLSSPDPVTGSTYAYWWAVLYPYVKNVGVFACPSRMGETTSWSKHDISYAYNDFLCKEWTGGNWTDANWNTQNMYAQVSLDSVPSPSDMIFVSDGPPGWGVLPTNLATSPSAFQYAAQCHDGRINIAFLDGHAKALKPSQTVWPKFLWTQTYPAAEGPWTSWAYSEKEMQDWCATQDTDGWLRAN